MPAYVPTDWQNETPAESPVKYKITETTDGDITPSAAIEPVTSITPGTPLNSTNLNHIEDGLEALNSHDHTGGLGAQIPAAGLENNAVTDIKLRDSAAYSVIGRSASSSGDPGDIAAGADEYVLRRRAGSLSFGQVFEGGIANDAVSDIKAGDRVPQFYRRQGGSASDWSTPGTSSHTPGAVRMQAGNFAWSGSAAAGGSGTVTFPVAFSNAPLVIIVPQGSNGKLAVSVQVPSTTQFTFTWNNVFDAQTFTSTNFMWLAIGPE